MATRQWLGSATHVPQIDTIDVSALAVAATATIAINGVEVSYTKPAAADDPSVGLVAAIAASQNGEFRDVQATTIAGPLVEIRSSGNRGIPYALTAVSNATLASVQTATGANFADNADNWSGGVLPGAADDVVFDQGNVSCLYGLDGFTGVAFASVRVSGFEGAIGLPSWNPAGFAEYRGEFFQCAPLTVIIDSAASSLVKIDLETSTGTVQVVNASVSTIPAVQLKGGAAGNTVSVASGTVGIGYNSESTTVTNLLQTDGTILCGSTATVTNIDKSGGTLVLDADAADVNNEGGATTIRYASAVGQLRVAGGTVNHDSTGTLGGSTVVSGTGTLDFSGDLRDRTVTNPIEIHGSRAILRDPHKSVTGLTLDMNEAADLSRLELGRDIRITRGATA